MELTFRIVLMNLVHYFLKFVAIDISEFSHINQEKECQCHEPLDVL